MTDAHTQTDLQPLINVTILVYALQAASFFLGVTFIAAVIINYVKREDVQGTWLESHFRWQIRTFWYGLLWSVIGVITFPIFIGIFIFAADFIWILYRIIKGWLRLNDKKEMYSYSGVTK
ncbi:MAG: hypothetical protein HY028_00940 [Gammaproteobacteria bacterium]|nr:hypothetical protein [Gammaproteobacteria bacterium]